MTSPSANHPPQVYLPHHSRRCLHSRGHRSRKGFSTPRLGSAALHAFTWAAACAATRYQVSADELAKQLNPHPSAHRLALDEGNLPYATTKASTSPHTNICAQRARVRQSGQWARSTTQADFLLSRTSHATLSNNHAIRPVQRGLDAVASTATQDATTARIGGCAAAALGSCKHAVTPPARFRAHPCHGCGSGGQKEAAETGAAAKEPCCVLATRSLGLAGRATHRCRPSRRTPGAARAAALESTTFVAAGGELRCFTPRQSVVR